MADSPAPSIKNKVIAGAAWMVAIKWSSRLLGLISTMVLARLLTPEDFGIVAIAIGIIGIIDAFFDFGFDLALIKNRETTRKDYDLVWTLRLVNMLVFGMLIALASPFVAQYSNAPEVLPVCLVMAASIALRGLGNVGTINFQKELDFSRLFRFTFYPRILTVGTTVVMAFTLRSYWAIIIGGLASAVYYVVFSYVMSPFRPRLRLQGASHIWNFSKWVLLANMARQLFNTTDKFLLSGLVSKSQLGHYNVAGSLASIVTIELLTPVGSALMPGFAKLQSEPERLRNAFLQSITVLVALTIPAAFGVWLIAPELVRVLLGGQWEESINLVSLFGFFFMFFSMSETLSSFMAMVGLIGKSARLGVVRTLSFLAVFYFAFQYNGLEGVIQLKILLGGLEVLLLFELSRRFVGLPSSALFSILWRPLFATTLMVGVVLQLPTFGLVTPLALLLFKSGIGALTYMGVSLLLWLVARKPEGLESLAITLIKGKLSDRASGPSAT